MNKKKKYPPAFKARVALEALKEEKTIAQISAEYEIHSNLVSKWKKQLKDNIASVFEGKTGIEPGVDGQLDNLYKEIGKLQVQNEWLKKKLSL